LRRLETGYIDQNRRELELTKQFSFSSVVQPAQEFPNPVAVPEPNQRRKSLRVADVVESFPFRDEGKTLKVNSIWLLAECTNSGSYTAVDGFGSLSPLQYFLHD